MKAKLLIFVTLVIQGSACVFGADRANLYSGIGRPSIFWHDGEWQVYQDGHWIPYAETRPAPAVEPQNYPEPFVQQPEPAAVDTNDVYYDWGWGYGFPVFSPSHRHHFTRPRHFNGRSAASLNLNGRAIGNIGRNGIGQQSRGLGQTTIGIGQPTIGIGKPTIAIGPQVHAGGAHSHGHSEPSESSHR